MRTLFKAAGGAALVLLPAVAAAPRQNATFLTLFASAGCSNSGRSRKGARVLIITF